MLKHSQKRVQVDASTLDCAKTNMSTKKESKEKFCDKAVQQHCVLVKMFCQLTAYAVIVRETTEASQSELYFTRAELGIL